MYCLNLTEKNLRRRKVHASERASERVKFQYLNFNGFPCTFQRSIRLTLLHFKLATATTTTTYVGVFLNSAASRAACTTNKNNCEAAVQMQMRNPIRAMSCNRMEAVCVGEVNQKKPGHRTAWKCDVPRDPVSHTCKITASIKIAMATDFHNLSPSFEYFARASNAIHER